MLTDWLSVGHPVGVSISRRSINQSISSWLVMQFDIQSISQSLANQSVGQTVNLSISHSSQSVNRLSISIQSSPVTHSHNQSQAMKQVLSIG